MQSLKLYKKHSKAELLALMDALERDPANLSAPGDLHKLAPKPRKRYFALVQAVAYHMQDERRTVNPAPVYGYSGRKQNRR